MGEWEWGGDGRAGGGGAGGVGTEGARHGDVQAQGSSVPDQQGSSPFASALCPCWPALQPNAAELPSRQPTCSSAPPCCPSKRHQAAHVSPTSAGMGSSAGNQVNVKQGDGGLA